MAYSLDFTSRVDRELDELPFDLQGRVLSRLARIMAQPRGPRANKLEGYVDVWAIRTGDYRAVYTIDDSAGMILVEAVGHRREVYRRLRRIPHLR